MRPLRGMSFIDVLVGCALMLTVFLALTALLRASLVISSISKSKTIATAVAGSQMEYIRSLSYERVGTVGGIPPGEIPQYATTTSNGIAFLTRTYIEYADDPADGLESADENLITTDYKRIKIQVTYTAAGRPQSVELHSNYAPPGVETTTGGGTLRVNVVNAVGAPVAGASVRIQNPSVSPAVDLTTFSNAAGLVYLPGAATSTDYRVSVSKEGYSSAQTYERDATNQNPNPGYLTVVKDQTTTGTFAIDLMTTFRIATFSPIATTTWNDSFDTSGQVAAQSNVSISGGDVVLASNEFGYIGSGSAQSEVVEPAYLAGWSSVDLSTVAPVGTEVQVQVLDGSGAPLTDEVLPGNSTGFTSSIDLSSVPHTAYPALALRAMLSSNSVLATPSLADWTITYQHGPVPLPDIDFSLTGAKTIGTTGAGEPLYKIAVTSATDSTGVRSLSLEWDAYTLDLNSHDTIDACNAPPFVLAPGTTLESSLVLATSTPHMALVSVRGGGAAVAGAAVTLSRTGFTQTVPTSTCGAAYFGDMTPASDYTVSVSAPGYTTVSVPSVSVSGKLFYAISFE